MGIIQIFIFVMLINFCIGAVLLVLGFLGKVPFFPGLLITTTSMVLIVVAMNTYSFFDQSYETNVIQTTYLVSFGNTEKIDGDGYGSFLHSRININEIPIYRYMYENDDGQLVMGEIDATIPVKETDNGKPRIEVTERCFTEKITRLWLGDCTETETTIYIPEGSIVHDFNIDVTK